MINYLAETPQILRDMEYIKDPRMYGNKMYGTPASKSISSWGRRLQADWMRDVAVGESDTYIDEKTGEEVERVPLMNLQKIRSLGYISEAIAWNPDGNFDRIDAMTQVMILREQLMKFDAKESVQRVKTKAKDDFFARMDKYTQTAQRYNLQKNYASSFGN